MQLGLADEIKEEQKKPTLPRGESTVKNIRRAANDVLLKIPNNSNNC